MAKNNNGLRIIFHLHNTNVINFYDEQLNNLFLFF